MTHSRNRRMVTYLAGGLLMLLLPLTYAYSQQDDNGPDRLRARLNGFQEVPGIMTTGFGEFEAKIVGATIVYTLTYEALETPAFQAHVHFGNRATNGGVMFFLCGGGDKPPCPPIAGTVSGVIDPTDIVGPNSQGIEPGNFADAVRALHSGDTYANVHTSRFPGGEIRGQISDNRDPKEE